MTFTVSRERAAIALAFLTQTTAQASYEASQVSARCAERGRARRRLASLPTIPVLGDALLVPR